MGQVLSKLCIFLCVIGLSGGVNRAFADISVDILDTGVRISEDGIKIIDRVHYDGPVIDIEFGETRTDFFSLSHPLCQSIYDHNLIVVDQKVQMENGGYKIYQILLEPYGSGSNQDGQEVLIGVQRKMLYAMEVGGAEDSEAVKDESVMENFEEGRVIEIRLEDLSSVHLVQGKKFSPDVEVSTDVRERLSDPRCTAPLLEEE